MFPYVPTVYARIAWSLFVTMFDPAAWVPMIQAPVVRERPEDEA